MMLKLKEEYIIASTFWIALIVFIASIAGAIYMGKKLLDGSKKSK